MHLRTLLPSLLPALWVAAASPAPAAAQADDVTSYAIVVGSNDGGPGQDTLRYAEDDARRVATVLRELGGYEREHVRMVLAPSPKDLNDAIASVAKKLARDQEAGRRTLVFFYYSGHARASGLSLGDDEVALTDLRASLTALPATVKIVVLDACQSGAITRVKGAQAAADFSYNSRTGLDAAGFAVMASSSESELSQESDFLKGSYFTHHLLVGLRGGGDRDDDGRVSLDEAYQYAYDQTLLATAATSVGSQHVSLEVELQGEGDLPLTYPERADATLRLDATIAGDVLIERLPAEAVLAEVHKVAGESFDVAVPAGKYRVLIRTAAAIHTCRATVSSGGATTVEDTGCDELSLVEGTAKGGGGATIVHPWQVELSAGLGGGVSDAYTATLDDFGYRKDGVRGTLSIAAQRRIAPHLAVGGRLTRVSSETWSRDTELEPLEFSVTSYAATALGRAEAATADDRNLAWVEAGLGLTLARDRFEDEMDAVAVGNHVWGHLTAGVGVSHYFAAGFGLGLDAHYLYAPTLDNEFDDPDTMDVGGLFVGLSVSFRP